MSILSWFGLARLVDLEEQRDMNIMLESRLKGVEKKVREADELMHDLETRATALAASNEGLRASRKTMYKEVMQIVREYDKYMQAQHIGQPNGTPKGRRDMRAKMYKMFKGFVKGWVNI